MGARGEFVVDGQPPEAGEPGKGALHDPTLRHVHEAAGTGRAAANLVREPEAGPVPGKAPAIAPVRHHRDQALAPIGSGRQQGKSFYPVVPVGRMDPASQNAALYIGQNPTFTAIDVLAPLDAPVLKDARGEAHALAIEADERGRSGSVGGQPVRLVDSIRQGLPPADERPATEIVVASVKSLVQKLSKSLPNKVFTH